ncbi:dipeptidase PepE [Acidipropionibacterium virtanenii]|uniref:Peptidase E n=1 Tax=Acidipropionibacterium virtanenii TaxID=2057246 RepID=A0A344UQX1_9ACTN|nr:dipeptidase PepE [Acidipropionibacterium virtanenii]AXE37669.1 Peptidase E [Acidipropionibacterium virtanenii]
MRAFLLSNSTCSGNTYLNHAKDDLARFLDGIDELFFVPFALADVDGYTAVAARFFAGIGISVTGAHRVSTGLLSQAPAIFTGGGNTFRLVKALHETGRMEAIQQAVADGASYLGASAGTNIAAPTLSTTNDMPIVEPPSFSTLGLVPFQINPHYLDPVPGDTHMGETREERIVQYLEENETPVLGLREGTWLRCEDGRYFLEGMERGARLFRRGAEPAEFSAPAELTSVLTRG